MSNDDHPQRLMKSAAPQRPSETVDFDELDTLITEESAWILVDDTWVRVESIDAVGPSTAYEDDDDEPVSDSNEDAFIAAGIADGTIEPDSEDENTGVAILLNSGEVIYGEASVNEVMGLVLDAEASE